MLGDGDSYETGSDSGENNDTSSENNDSEPVSVFSDEGASTEQGRGGGSAAETASETGSSAGKDGSESSVSVFSEGGKSEGDVTGTGKTETAVAGKGAEVQNEVQGKQDAQEKNAEVKENAAKTEALEKETTYAPQTTLRIDGRSYRTDDKGDIHMYKDDNGWHLMPNTEYTSKGYTYRTDANGHIEYASGTIKDTDEGRKSLNDKVEGMEKGDQRGHVIADRFGASNRIDNLVPMMSEVNQGKYKSLEDHLAKESENHDVRAEYFITYPKEGNTARPESITVHYSIDGEESEATFDNRR